MLDDPVQESLDTAVDSRRSNVAKLKVGGDKQSPQEVNYHLY